MRKKLLLLLGIVLCMTIGAAQAQEGPERGRPGRGEERGQPLFGKIASISGDSLELNKPDGTTAKVKITPQTEFRKDRQPAKREDFKAGDMVMVRAEEDSAHNLVAVRIGGRSGAGPQEGGRGFGGGRMMGEMGKDFVVGEVKSIDAPRITILRPDNVTQTIELNEETSLRRGRESITMADIHPGDHLMARGALQNNAFVPKNVMVFSAEDWERMQEMRRSRESSGKEPSSPPRNDPPKP